jgi:hypothetical protein
VDYIGNPETRMIDFFLFFGPKGTVIKFKIGFRPSTAMRQA